jgi:glycosyltransferase involved in cell wall biosynthesis
MCTLLAGRRGNDGLFTRFITSLQESQAGFGVVGGMPELVADGVSGLLVPVGNLEALSEAMAQLGCDASRRAAMGKAARQTALERFDVRVMSKARAAFYQRLLNS